MSVYQKYHTAKPHICICSFFFFNRDNADKHSNNTNPAADVQHIEFI